LSADNGHGGFAWPELGNRAQRPAKRRLTELRPIPAYLDLLPFLQ
jgi:hypothetical protein